MTTQRLAGILLALLLLAGTAGAQVYDDFTGDELDPVWTWVREHPSHHALIPDYLVIRTERGALNGVEYNNVNNILLQDVPSDGIIRMETLLLFTPEYWYHNAGLIYRVDDDNYVRVSRGIYPDVNGVWMEWEVDGSTDFHFVNDIRSDTTWLRLLRNGSEYVAYYSLNGTDWSEIGREVLNFPSGTTQAGLQAANGDGLAAQGGQLTAMFDYFGMQPTAVSRTDALPSNLRILSVHPQPLQTGAEAVTTFRLDRAAAVQLQMTDLLGRRVASAVSGGQLSPGTHRIAFTAGGSHGSELAPGMYFLRITAGTAAATHRILLTR